MLFSRLARRSSIKFEINTIGVFDVISSQMEKGEVYDSSKLLKTSIFLIKNDVRNLIIDISNLDYIYSDAINAIIAVNRHMIQVNGRVGILATNDKVNQTLNASGIQNMMNIFKSQEEIIATSNEIKKQSSGLITDEEEDVSSMEPEEAGLSVVSAQEELSSDNDANKKQAEPTLEAGEEELPLEDNASFEEDTSEIFGESEAGDQFGELTEEESHAFQTAEPPDEPQASKPDKAPSEFAADETKTDSKPDKDETPNNRNRLAPQDRLRSKSARSISSKRSAMQKTWSQVEEGNTGLILMDDTVEGTEFDKREIPEKPINLLDEEKPKRTASFLLGIILILCILGGLAYLVRNSSIKFTPQKLKTEKPFLSKAREAAQEKPAIPDKPKAPEPRKILKDEKPVQPKAEKPQKIARYIPKKPRTPKPVKKSTPVYSASPGGKTLRITSTPSGASVLVNFAKKGETPLNINLLNVNNSIVVKLDGYKTFTSRIARADADKKLHVNLEKIERAPKAAAPKKKVKPPPAPKPKKVAAPKPVEPAPPKEKTIEVTSSPSGAKVFLNSKNIGTTPLKVPLSNKVNEILVEKNGYKTFKASLNKNTSKKSVHAKLASIQVKKPPAPKPVADGPIGRIFLASRPPGADVIVNGKSMGFQTPHWLEIPSGSHTLVLTKAGMRAEKMIKVNPGKNKSAYLVLK